jgi:hypothetical protein
MITLSFMETEPPYGCPTKEIDAVCPCLEVQRPEGSTVTVSEGTSNMEAIKILSKEGIQKMLLQTSF